jgi:hypothetical protein
MKTAAAEHAKLPARIATDMHLACPPPPPSFCLLYLCKIIDSILNSFQCTVIEPFNMLLHRFCCKQCKFLLLKMVFGLEIELVWRPRICAAELTTLIYTATIKNQSYLLFWLSKFIFIVLFLFLYFNFYIDCIRSGIMVVCKLIF